MREVKITCDKCGLSIQPIDPRFDARHMAGGGSLAVLQRMGGGMGHNQVPPEGWHFHYLCFCEVVSAILETLQPEPSRVASG